MMVEHAANAAHVLTTTAMSTAAVATTAAGVHDGAAGENARAARLPVAALSGRLGHGLDLADLLLLEALELATLGFPESDVLVSLAVGGVACGDGAFLLLARFGEQCAQ